MPDNKLRVIVMTQADRFFIPKNIDRAAQVCELLEIVEVNCKSALENEFNRLQPSECIISNGCHEQYTQEGFPDVPAHLTWTTVDDWTFDLEMARDSLCRHFNVASLDGFGCRGMTLAVSAAGALISYVQNSLRSASRPEPHYLHAVLQYG